MKPLAIAFALTTLSFTSVFAQSDRVTPIAELQKGTMATVQGTIDRILDEDEFQISDTSGSVRVYVGPNWVPAEVGEAVTVNGFVDNDLGPLEIYARSLIRADGSVVAFAHREE